METIVIIREAEEADVPVIQRIARETWAFTYRGVIPDDVQDQAIRSWYSSDLLKAQIPASSSQLLVAEEPAGRCVGFAQFVKHSADIGELTRIYVLPDYHGQGFGFRLLREGLAWLRNQGVKSLVVNVEEQNPLGRRFYERTGFIETRMSTQEVFGHELSTVVYHRQVA